MFSLRYLSNSIGKQSLAPSPKREEIGSFSLHHHTDTGLGDTRTVVVHFLHNFHYQCHLFDQWHQSLAPFSSLICSVRKHTPRNYCTPSCLCYYRDFPALSYSYAYAEFPQALIVQLSPVTCHAHIWSTWWFHACCPSGNTCQSSFQMLLVVLCCVRAWESLSFGFDGEPHFYEGNNFPFSIFKKSGSCCHTSNPLARLSRNQTLCL